MLFVLILFVWLCSEQERFIGNLILDNQNETRFFLPNVHSRNISLIMLAIFAVAELGQTENQILGWLSFACGFALLARLQDWHYRELLGSAAIAQYYIALWSLIFGFACYGAALLFFPAYTGSAGKILQICTALWGYLTLLFWWKWAKN